MKVFIKNMVCPRCIMAVERELNELAIPTTEVGLGFAKLKQGINEEQIHKLEERLEAIGFELLKTEKSKQIEAIKNLLIRKLQESQLEEYFSVRKYLSLHFDKEYSSVSKLFSQNEGLSIEQYFILLKLEKVKELLTYGEEPLSVIAKRLGYCSVQHLSTQFKKMLNVSANEFKKSIHGKRQFIDQINVLNK